MLLGCGAFSAADFRRLNIAWIERLFAVEPHDLAVLDDPVGATVRLRLGRNHFRPAPLQVQATVVGRTITEIQVDQSLVRDL